MGKQERDEILNALADYIASEGCSCCQNIDAHKAAATRLGKLLRVPKYKDWDGYNFYKFKTKEAE